MNPTTKAGIAAWENIFQWYLDHGPGPVTVDQIVAIETEASRIDPDRLARALHRYWHTDDAWGNVVSRETDMENHRRNADGLVKAYEKEG